MPTIVGEYVIDKYGVNLARYKFCSIFPISQLKSNYHCESKMVGSLIGTWIDTPLWYRVKSVKEIYF